jgi:hypothetical protein
MQGELQIFRICGSSLTIKLRHWSASHLAYHAVSVLIVLVSPESLNGDCAQPKIVKLIDYHSLMRFI